MGAVLPPETPFGLPTLWPERWESSFREDLSWSSQIGGGEESQGAPLLVFFLPLPSRGENWLVTMGWGPEEDSGEIVVLEDAGKSSVEVFLFFPFFFKEVGLLWKKRKIEESFHFEELFFVQTFFFAFLKMEKERFPSKAFFRLLGFLEREGRGAVLPFSGSGIFPIEKQIRRSSRRSSHIRFFFFFSGLRTGERSPEGYFFLVPLN